MLGTPTVSSEGELAEREIVGGGELVPYRVTGKGPPLVLVHGLAGSTRWWARTLPDLGKQHCVHLVDLPGFGGMRGLGRGFGLADTASWLLAWIEALGIAPVSLVGHSMGAAICIRAAAERRDAVDRLVLVAPIGLSVDRSLLGHVFPLLVTLRRSSPRFLWLVAQDAARAGPRTLWGSARKVLAEDVREALRAVSAPTLLLFGENDSLVPPALGEVFRRAIAGSRLVVLDGAGHVPMFDRPQAFNTAVLAFLREGGGSGAPSRA